MTDEITNKTLAFLLVGAILVSLFGTFISLSRLNQISDLGLFGITGRATSGTVDLTVTGLQSFDVMTSVDFGTIQPNITSLWISTNSNNTWANDSGLINNCEKATDPCQGMVIKNDGNVVLNISFNSTEDAASLIGGAGPLFRFNVRNGNESGATNEDGCSGAIPNNDSGAVWFDVAADTPYVLCNTSTAGTGFNYSEGSDKVTIEFNLTIPSDAPQVANTQALITVFNT